MAHTNATCRHDACHCEVAEAGKFCSDYCREAADDPAGQACQCGHLSCEAAMQDDDPLDGPQ
jgi:hypothetical protein